MTRKERRHSGRVYPQPTIRISKQELIDMCLDPQPYWDDWQDRRDGLRDVYNDYKKIKKHPFPDEERKKRNAKQKRLLKRRKSRKELSSVQIIV